MARDKRLKVSEDTQIHMSTTYTRKKGNKKSERRSFNFVIKGLLISTTLVGSLLMTNGVVEASSNAPTTPIVETVRTVDEYQDETAMISNLKMATNILEAGIKAGQINTGMYDTVMQRISAIDNKLTQERQFNKVGDLVPVLEQSDKVLKSSIKTKDNNIISKRQESIQALTDLQAKFGLKSSYSEQSVESGTPSVVKVADTKITSKVVYNDFDSNAYWSKDMLWAIEKGMISGYKNTKHPTNKNSKVGNWLNPYGNLTEVQMLAVLFRYFEPEEIASRRADDSWWGTSAYELAKENGIPTVASVKDRSKSSRTVNRGETAIAIATVHYGKPVSLQTAVDFMYKAGISHGTDQSKPKDVANYNPKGQLKRAHIVAFMSRYNDYLANGGVSSKVEVKPSPPKQEVSQTEQKKPTQNQNGIKVLYGSHDYGSANQAEYDQVMKIVHDAMKGYENEFYAGTDRYYEDQLEAFFNGERGTQDRRDPNFRSHHNTGLVAAEAYFGELVDLGISTETIKDVGRLSGVASKLEKGEDPGDGSPRSAYDALVRGVVDCDPIAHIQSAVFDAAGYNTMILGKPGHATAFVEMDGHWVNVEVGYRVMNVDSMLSGAWHIHTPATK